MTLTKNDLKAIDGLLVRRLQPLEKKTDKNFIFLKNRFDELFDFLIQGHLRLPVSDF